MKITVVRGCERANILPLGVSFYKPHSLGGWTGFTLLNV